MLCTVHYFGLSLPENMREEVGYTVKDISDKAHKELSTGNYLSDF